ncbi:MAG: CBU_0592 family membrane protein [Bacteroidia bacterium]
MGLPDIINTIGASLILIAFFLLMLKKISATDKSYLLLNIFGAGLTCYGAFLLGTMPFVVLEGVWCLVAVYGLIKKKD